MDLEVIMISEISQTEKDKCQMISLICKIYKTKYMNKQNRNRFIDTETILMGGSLGECVKNVKGLIVTE